MADEPIPSLDPIADAIANMDTRPIELMEHYWSEYYPKAPINWQIRWHLLRCELAYMASDGKEVDHQVATGVALAQKAGNSLVEGYFSVCRASYLFSEEQRQLATEAYTKSIEIGEQHQDPHLLMLAYTSRATSLADQGHLPMALEDLTMALRQKEHLSDSQWLHITLAQVHFVLGRTFYYFENYPRAMESMELAITLAKPGSPLEWFIRFNFAVALSQLDQPIRAQQQLDRLHDNPPELGKYHQGFFNLFRAEVLLKLGRFDEALPLARAAAMDFARVDMLATYAKALIVEGQSYVLMGNTEAGWQTIAKAQDILFKEEEARGDWGYLAKSWRWIADYHHQRGDFEGAYEALLQYTEVQSRFLDKQQASELERQQRALSEEADRHRQRLVSSSEAQFHLQQSLLMWRGASVVLGLILMGIFIWRFWPVTESPQPQAAPEGWRETLNRAINDSRQSERPLAVILVRDPTQPLGESTTLLKRDLRPEDRLLLPEPHTALLLMDQAADGELAWRLASLTQLLQGAGRGSLLLAKARVNGFDDQETLLARLEYELISQSIPNRSESQPQAESASA
ncbi:tetratricopeptide repeat protein [Ferrimonas balearica]|uniref:tetratricopeptide repeat protein n=1 Tax=Ferrimonas balearica TaxID=44012 RepID=UPI001C99A978|nr:hypothetical protein [Ferrimonas balearica]MBY5993331.1 hypothetical protein [Ferrimonas balearica]